jgi:hypothetical protein
MTDQPVTTAKPSKKLPTIAIVAIGCFVLLAIVGFGLSIAGKVLLSKFGGDLVKKGIESKTGLKVDNKGNTVSFTDSKTGESVNFGEQKMPENFPKDFPLYPGAKFTGSLTGNNKKADTQGFWIIMSTPDALTKVKAFYTANLDKSGWVIDNTMNLNEMTTWTVKKATLGGGVTVTRGANDKETTITITLGTDKTGPTNTNPAQSGTTTEESPAETLPEEPGM